MIIYVIALLVSFFFPDVISLCLGFILVRTVLFHRVGVRMLAMSMFCPARVIASKCHLNCSAVKCGNWTCANYHDPKK